MAAAKMARTIPLVLAIATAALTVACTKTTAVDTRDIEIACTSTQPESNEPISELSRADLYENAEVAEKRLSAAHRISTADKRYAPLAEALGIISDAAQTLTQGEEANSHSVDWDLVKLAQAAAADQCSLLTRD